jgi:GNAT superfamily N-acetyltransferase
MPISIQQADLAADRDRLTELMREHLNPLSTRDRYEWLYEKNPDGPALIWLAVDDDAGAKIVGSAAALPRRMYCGGEAVPGCVLADFWVDPAYRSLGPALKLQRAVLAAIDDKFAVAYDLPRRSMAAVYKRLGFSLDAGLRRLTRPVRIDRYVEQRLRVPGLTRLLAAAGNGLVAARDALSTRRPRHEIEYTDASFDTSFTELAASRARDYTLCVARSEQYLNWRFRDHFHHRFKLLTARRDGRLGGYLVVNVDGQSFDVVDCLFGADPTVVRDLLSAAIPIARGTGCHALNIPVFEASPVVEMLTGLGFYSRESQTLLAYDPKLSSKTKQRVHEPGWWFTPGDESD